MSEVKKVEAQQSSISPSAKTTDMKTVWTVWGKVDGPGTYYIVPGEVWEVAETITEGEK